MKANFFSFSFSEWRRHLQFKFRLLLLLQIFCDEENCWILKEKNSECSQPPKVFLILSIGSFWI